MADVRLTATNPEDSSVVPVACDAAGRLLLEEPQVITGPPGPDGEQGPPGQDGQDGDPFSGNFAGDVTFGGSASIAKDVVAGGAEFAGRTDVGSSTLANHGIAVKNSSTSQGTLFTQNSGTVPSPLIQGFDGGLAKKVEIFNNGAASFAGILKVGNRAGGEQNRSGGDISPSGGVFTQKLATDADSTYAFRYTRGRSIGGGPAEGDKFAVYADGTVEFAGKKAGFTSEGHLWCTTTRGETVMLEFTANGMGQWVEYTPTTRLDEISDNLDANRGDTGEMPADTP